MNCEQVARRTQNFIKFYVEAAGTKGVVLGLSGGIDSAVVAVLAKNALGPGMMQALLLPAGKDQVNSTNMMDAVLLAEKFKIPSLTIDIAPILKSYEDGGLLSAADKLVKGNLAARVRMTILYTFANHNNLLVIGTTNLTEYEVGYFTKWGDGAVDLEPIMPLYKSEVRELAAYLGVPEDIITKPPTADLWPGQTDEGELGITYDVLDLVLQGKILDAELIDKVHSLKKKSDHKRVEIPNPTRVVMAE